MKKLLVILCLINCTVRSQNPLFQWGGTAQGNITMGRSVTSDSFGNVYVAGYFSGTKDFDPGPGTFTLASNGIYEDVYVCKFNAGGNLLWAKSAGGPWQDYLYSIALDSFGNVYTTGRFQATADFDPGPGVFNLNSTGSFDAFIWKLDANGNFVWAKSATSLASGGEQGQCVRVDPSGNILITGYFNGTVDFDPGIPSYTVSSVAPLTYDVFVLKLNSSGSFVWVKNFGGSSTDLGNSLSQDALGNIFITGDFYGTADFDPGPASYTLAATSTTATDIYVLKLDVSGNFLWAKCFTGQGQDHGSSIAADAAGNVYLTGGFSGPVIDFDPGPGVYTVTPPPNFQDIYVAKLDPSGNFSWVKTAGTPADDSGVQLALDQGGNVFIAGLFSSGTDFDPGPGIYQLFGTQGSNGFIWKLDPSGNFIWAGDIEGGPYGISTDTVGNVYATGAFNNTLDFDPGPGVYNMLAAGGPAMFIIKLGTCSAVSASVTAQNLNCSGANNGAASVIATGCPPFTYSWSPVNAVSASVTGLSPGLYNCIVTNSCFATVQVSVNLTANNITPTVSAVSAASVICYGSVATLTASGANTYSWSTGSTNSTVAVTPTANSIYTVVGTGAGGCSDTASVQINVVVCTGIEALNGKDQDLKLYPNPVSEMLFIELPYDYKQKVNIVLFDIYGRTVFGAALAGKSVSCNIAYLSSGIYFLRIEGSDKKAYKVIKE